MTRTLPILLAVLGAACTRAGDPPAAAAPLTGAAPATAAPAAKPDDATDEGELRAGVAAAHRVGAPGPAMVLTPLDGPPIDLAKLYGAKPVYLKMWATWCIPCREQMPAFERIYEALGDRMQVIAVNAGMDDDEASVRAFRTKYGLRMPVVIDDGRLAAALDLQVTPQHVLIGRDARIAYVGHLDGPRLDGAIQQVLAAPGPGGPAAGQAIGERKVLRAGDVVPALEATLIDGSKRALGGPGQPRALVLFATWCESYLKETVPATSQACRRVREQVDQLAGHGDVQWLGVAQGLWTSRSDVTELQAKRPGLPLALDADGVVFRAFGVQRLPTVVLIDRAGRVARIVGPDDRDLAEAVQALGRK